MNNLHNTVCVTSPDYTKNKGSVLVMVLWILVVISFLSSEYIAHNREKTSIAIHATRVLEREAASLSVLELLASTQYDSLKLKAQEENSDRDTKTDKNDKSLTRKDDLQNTTAAPWIRLRPGGVAIWVKIKTEDSKIRFSLDQESNIRSAMYSIYGTEREEEADAFTDALLDWIDPDDLVRPNGAEQDYYNSTYPPCSIGNSPFQSMSQIFLVKGFSSALFWPDPYEYLSELPVYDDLNDNYDLQRNSYSKNRNSSSELHTSNRDKQESDVVDNGKIQAILEQFTIYPKSCIRVSMLFPEDGDRWSNEIFWITKENNSFDITEQLSRIMIVHTDGQY